MRITIARTAGFCMGVRQAVEMAVKASNETQPPIYTYGPLIHNPQVLSVLAEKGISVLDKIPESGEGTIIIRAHGIPPEEKTALKVAGFKVLDATCPNVIKVQTIIKRHTTDGYAAIIIGDSQHPEVKGLLGYAGNQGYIVDSIEALRRLPGFEKAIIVSQTTQNLSFFRDVQCWAKQHHPHYKVFNTICDSSKNRQAEVRTLASSVDAILVVGGHDSGNTKRLYETASSTGKPAQHIETEEELDVNQLEGCRHIGITAGASTPDWIIERVYRALENRVMKRDLVLCRSFFHIQRHLLLSNSYLAAGAGCLAYVSAMMLEFPVSASGILMPMLYILCMHTFNNLIDTSTDRYSDPDRAAFYQKNRAWLSALTFIAGTAVLLIAYSMGPGFFILLAVMLLLGMVYNVRLITGGIGKARKSRIRDIPGSKTVLISLAWAIVTTLLPAVYHKCAVHEGVAVVYCWVCGLVFIQDSFSDVMAMQGGQITGKETVPILLGEKRTMRLLKIISGAMAVLIWYAAALRIVAPSGFLIGFCPVFILLSLYIHEQGKVSPGFRKSLLMEGYFILAGLLAALGSAVFT